MTYLMDLTDVDMGIFSANDGAFKLFNIPIQSHNLYNERYSDIDPLRPNNAADNADKKVSTIRQLVLPNAVASCDFYHEFTRSLGFADKAAMYLYHNDEMFAVISLIRGDGDFSPSMIEHLKKAQPLIEHLAAEIFLPQGQIKREQLAKQFGLTRRELEVLDVVCSGASNQSTANALCISLTTVKTHMRNLFEKTGCRNRAELLASFYNA
jgi:DNA-binding CsgD family transcriptional regulator